MHGTTFTAWLAAFALTVSLTKGAPPATPTLRLTTEIPTETGVQYDSDVEWRCVLPGYNSHYERQWPTHRFSYFVDGVEVLHTNAPIWSEGHVRQYDSGSYSCIAINRDGNSSRSNAITLTVDEVVCTTFSDDPLAMQCGDYEMNKYFYQRDRFAGCYYSQRRCDGVFNCLDGSDEHNCESCPVYPGVYPAGTFGLPLWRCPTGRPMCIWSYWRCDGRTHCQGGEDELNCGLQVIATPGFQESLSPCDSWEVRCENPDRPECIDQSWLCDGQNDCGNGWDETPAACLNVPCRSNHLRCDNPHRPRCIHQIYFCDGDDHCGNNWDETAAACQSIPCGSGWIRCVDPDGPRCIPQTWRCDRVNNCRNGWDETNCTTRG